ncbi:diacylglycerol/lipid kinase family protein [Roseiterribacter gracilis]|uniref:Diacylglycerol kinase n=1 Tax=Roseiterribacter gracilis TaxID=2812848 RepID=A0A8S8X828_9PROT|nr:diacylglycerol kinase [Rhodospirillales bacterium TMPK1]
MIRRYAVILNASAGGLIGRDMDAVAAEVVARFAALGVTATVELPQGREIDRAVQRLRDDAATPDAIIVGGGDGTIAHAAQLLAQGGPPLGILPFGTLNLLARDLGIPFALEDAIAALATATPRKIDLGDANGVPFCCMATLGLVPMLGRVREKQRGMPPLVAWPRLAGSWLRALYWDPKLALTLEAGTRPRKMRTRGMGIAVGAYMEGRFLQRASLDQGVLVAYTARHRSRWALLRFVIDLATGRWAGDPELDIVSGTALTVQTHRKRLAVMLDGELVRMRTPLEFRVRPRALHVLAP